MRHINHAGIIMQCYFPLGGTKRDEIFKDIVMTETAAKHNATVPQVAYVFVLYV